VVVHDALGKQVVDTLSGNGPIRGEDVVEAAILPDVDDQVLDRSRGIGSRVWAFAR